MTNQAVQKNGGSFGNETNVQHWSLLHNKEFKNHQNFRVL